MRYGAENREWIESLPMEQLGLSIPPLHEVSVTQESYCQIPFFKEQNFLISLKGVNQHLLAFETPRPLEPPGQ